MARLFVAAVLLLFVFFQPQIFAATITVTTTSDAIADDGVCSLREAIIAANTNTASTDSSGTPCAAGEDVNTDTITLANGSIYALTIAGAGEDVSATGDLDITNNTAGTDVIINVASSGTATILQNASPDDRIFQTYSNAALQITGVTISNGSVADSGGAIWARGPLVLTNCTLSNNSAADSAGALYAQIFAFVTINNTTVSNNTAANGGAFVVGSTSTLTIENNSKVQSNHATTSGGAVLASGTVTINDSTISSNIGDDSGGALEILPGGDLSVTNSVFQGNQAVNNGGAIDYSGDTASITGSLFRLNTTTGEGDAFSFGAGGAPSITGSCFVGNGATAVFNNTGVTTGIATGNWWGSADGPNPPGTGDTISGLWDATGFLITPADGCTILVTTTADEVNSDGDCSLREAIRAANTNTAVDRCLTGTNTLTDYVRLANGGNYSLTISGSDEQATLTGDLDITNNAAAMELVLDVASNGVATISQDAATDDRVLDVLLGTNVQANNITFQNGGNVGNGAGINVAGTLQLNSCVVKLNNCTNSGGGINNTGTVALFDSDVTNNVAPNAGGGIRNSGSMQLTNGCLIASNNSGTGAGILNTSTLFVSGSTISSNTATALGGGIFNTGTMTIDTGSLIHHNSAPSGAGIYNNAATGTLDNSSVYANDATGTGGGIFNDGTLSIVNGAEIGGSFNTGDENTAQTGGGIGNFDGTVTIDGSTVAGNSASFAGGGISNQGTGSVTIQNGATIGTASLKNLATSLGGGIYNDKTLTIQSSTVTGNESDSSGGGVYVTSNGTATVNGSTVSSNHADSSGGGITNLGTLTVTNAATISGNTANVGGGIYNLVGASTTIEDSSTIQSNAANVTAGSNGGGIANEGTLTLQTDAVIQSNGANGSGGGLYNFATGTANISSTTFQDNTSDGAAGIHNIGTLTVQSSLFVLNTGDLCGGIFQAGGTATVTTSSFIANSSNGNGSAFRNSVNTLNALSVQNSCLRINDATSVFNDQAAFQDATGNWWGSADGPNPPGVGDTVSGNWDTTGFLTAPQTFCRPIPVLYNGDFEIDNNPADSRPDGFKYTKMSSSDVLDCTTTPGNCFFKVKGNGNTKKMTATLPLTGNIGESMTLVVQHKTSKVPSSGPMSYTVQFYQGTTVMEKATLNLTSGTHDWLVASKLIITTNAFDSVKITFKYKKDKGTVYLDDLSLILNP